MSPESWARMEQLFHEAEPLIARERGEFLRRRCPDDAELVHQVELLLAAGDSADGFVENALDERDRAAAAITGETPQGRIGPYRIVKRIGQGGMGAVYLAERADNQFEQRVAIKVVRAGRESPDILRRFLAERQILASLAHSNIARLLDGGLTEGGMPYVVMEYIEGIAVTAYCREHGLPVAARLDLFRKICAAVEHAHQALIVHRDIKPANVLVTAEGCPKLLDFGIARILGPGGEADRGQTRPTERLMTPEYAAPEQVRGGPITTATDVYALGVLLFELLTDERPFRQTGSTFELERQICTGSPRKPSEVRPARYLKGDLDNIVLKALRKEPSERYHSVARLSDDVGYFLAGFPVSASRGTVRYRAAKFVRRHWLAVSLASAMVLCLAGFGVAMSALAARAQQERDSARAERTRAETVSGFLTGLFRSADPFQSKGHTVTARDLLDRGAGQIAGDLRTEPAVRAALLETMAEAYQHAGAPDRAEALLKEKLRVERQTSAGGPPALVKTLRELGDVERDRSDLAAAEGYLREALAIDSRASAVDAERAHILNDLGLVVQTLGRPSDAAGMFREAVAMSRRFPDQAAETLAMMSNLGGALGSSAAYGEAIPVLREVLERRRKTLGSDHPQTGRSMLRLGIALEGAGAYDEAQRFLREALESSRKSLGEDHPDVLTAMATLASALQDRGDLPAAEPLYRQAIQRGEKTMGQHWVVAQWTSNLATLLEEKGEYAEAEKLLRASLAATRKLAGPETSTTARHLARIGRLLVRTGRLGEAEPYFADARRIQEATVGALHPQTADTVASWAELRAAQKRYEESVTLYETAIATDRRIFPAGHPQTATHLLGLGLVLMHHGDAARAQSLVGEALQVRRRFLPAGAWQIDAAENEQGQVLAWLGRRGEAQRLLADSYARLSRKLGQNAEASLVARREMREAPGFHVGR